MDGRGRHLIAGEYPRKQAQARWRPQDPRNAGSPPSAPGPGAPAIRSSYELLTRFGYASLTML
jgi:hypothetical protein